LDGEVIEGEVASIFIHKKVHGPSAELDETQLLPETHWAEVEEKANEAEG
jgi:hypothetical protein